jgi:hypothetical protein
VNGEIWAKIRSEMPFYLEKDDETWFDEDGEVLSRYPDNADLRIWDEGTGAGVYFHRFFQGIIVSVPAPQDPAACERIAEIIESADDGGKAWGPKAPRQVTRHGRAWVAGWNRQVGIHVMYRKPIVDTIIRIMQDGLGMDEERLRVRTWGVDALETEPEGPRSLRPTRSGAPARCTDWDDFTVRLDWVLRTLPHDGVLILDHPDVGDYGGYVQFLRDGFRLFDEVASRDVVGIGQDEFLRRLSAIGWKEGPRAWPGQEFPAWTCPADIRIDYDPNRDGDNLAGLVPRVAPVFRDALGLRSPQQLTFRAFRNGPVGDRLSYLDAELGLTRGAK